MRIPGGHHGHSCVCVLAALVAILGSSLLFGQEPIHVAVNLVNVAFSVRDARGALVDNLTREDVERVCSVIGRFR